MSALAAIWAWRMLWPEAYALEGQSTLTPATIKQLQKSNQSYKECIQTVSTAVKAGKLKGPEVKDAVAKCTDKYPASGLFTECKRNVLKNTKGREPNAEELAECKKQQIGASFDPNAPLPIFLAGQQAFFAGLGLNKALKLSEMDLPNFTCDRFGEATADIPNKAQHILFGNNPKMFLSGSDQSKFLDELKKAMGKPKKGAKNVDVSGLGRVFGDPTTAQSMIYFPSAPCDFKGVLGPAYSGMSIYYLPDLKAKTATPYFGIVYYKAGQQVHQTQQIVARLLAKLGKAYKAYTKDQQTVFIAATSFQEVDQERDPRNICKAPRPHQWVAVVRTLSSDHNAPEYLLLANVANLCDYGDRQAKNVARL